MKVLLTGATGLLGSHITELLLNQNIEVHALIRKIPRKSFIGSLGENLPAHLILIEADLDSYEPKHGDFFDAVIHSAAMVSSDETQKEQIWHTNFEATKGLYNRLEGKFKKWVQISSIATLCDGHDPLVDEKLHGHARDTHYAQSKLQADLWLMENHPDALIIHPTYMLGKWDSKPSSGAVLFALKLKRLNSFINNNKNFVAASDVALGILQAIKADIKGNYILGNVNMSIEEFLQAACAELHIDYELRSEALKAETPDFVKEFCLSANVSIEKAKNTFGYAPKKDLDAILTEVMDYFEESKMLKRSPTK